jgi:hypothetical protein
MSRNRAARAKSFASGHAPNDAGCTARRISVDSFSFTATGVDFIVNGMSKSILLLCLAATVSLGYAAETNFNVAMMESTCKLEGNGSTGTGIIILRPILKQPGRGLYTLVTADHVLTNMNGEKAMMTLRRAKKSDEWERLEIPITIRAGNTPLWVKHPEVDLAAMAVSLPTSAVRFSITTSQLMTDEKIREFEVNPGQELLCLGYPFGAESNTEGCFPILRSGRISSYLLLPTKKTKTFLFDFAVFKGNSGGPVYIYQQSPFYGGSIQMGITIRGVVGIVTQERNVTQRIEQLYERRETITPLALGEVIHASFIKELLDSMPQP